ncbi:MAG TPA: DUF6519 domain-containing protein [Trebonia sp.]|nr:DUF6519 domain-containing protein [Trebonia sp.]
MSSDRARITYDPSRHYHGVIAQQGRVSLEADWNEAQAIAGEQLEARTADFVGPAGSPDRGYQITPVKDGEKATGDLLITPGTLYVGGQRLSQPHEVRYGDQPEWADHEGDPLWRAPAVPGQPRELLYLLAREQEVSAVEDPALRDVALGGPDTAHRLRTLQHVIRYPTEAQTWEDAWGQLIEEEWIRGGFRVRHDTRRLEPVARLEVTAHPMDGGEQPADQGGYLGPNNQLIRVQIASIGGDGVPVLVWGYDNASFLYRLSSSVVSTAHTTLQLVSSPVDDYHQPREHQAVEVLRGAAPLTGGGYIASAVGVVARVTTGYDPDSREIVVGTELPPGYRKDAGAGPPLYLRVWEGEFRCEPGEEHELGGTGIRVRLTAPDGDHADKYPVGSYWMIAIRPGVGPGALGVVYPQRILDGPQPPDGPRQWLTPIAFVRWHPRAPETEDCVPRFGGLVRDERAGGSCTVRIRPRDIGGGWALQDAINEHTSRDHPATICLEPGTYVLPRPLRIGPEHGRLTIRATAPGVVLRAEPEAAAHFLLGMIIAVETEGFSLEGLEMHPAHARFTLDREAYVKLPERARLVLDAHRGRLVSIGLHAARCRDLSVDGCRFVFTLPAPEHSPGEDREDREDREEHGDLFGAAIFGAEELHGLRVTRCTFASGPLGDHAHRRPRAGEIAAGKHHVTLGFIQVPTAMAVPPPATGRGEEPARPRGSVSVPLLGDAVFDGNSFDRLTAPLVAIGQLGELRLERNTARDCHAGCWLVTQYGSHVLTLLDRLVNQVGDAYRDLENDRLTALAEPLLFHATALARALPHELPEDQENREDTAAAPRPRALEAPSATDERHASDLLRQLSTQDAPDVPDAAQESPPPAAERENWRRRLRDRFGQSGETRAEPEQVVVSPQATLSCRLSITGNAFDSGDAPALVVLDTARDSDASLILTGNQLRGHPLPGGTACLYLLRSCAAAANAIVHAEAADVLAASLVVLERGHRERRQTAVTGNVLAGRAYLPDRPDELPSWESLNSVTR